VKSFVDATTRKVDSNEGCQCQHRHSPQTRFWSAHH